MQLPINNVATLDKLGIWVSSLCAVHCLAMPLLPFLLSSVVGQEWFEQIVLSCSIVIGSIALISGAVRYHGQVYPLALLLGGGLIYWFKGSFGESVEPFAVTLGAALIILGHWLNLRMCKQCTCCANKGS